VKSSGYTAAEVMGNPLNALAWLANHLETRAAPQGQRDFASAADRSSTDHGLRRIDVIGYAAHQRKHYIHINPVTRETFFSLNAPTGIVDLPRSEQNSTWMYPDCAQ
jgi:hypothetical protein